MNRTFTSVLTTAALAACLVSVELAAVPQLASAQVEPDPPTIDLTLEDILPLPKSRASIYAPVRLVAGDSLTLTSLQLADGMSRPADAPRGMQVMVFAIDPTAPTYFKYVLKDVIVSSATGGQGAGKATFRDFHFADVPAEYHLADGSVRLLVAVVGYAVAGPGAAPEPGPLPKELSFTVQAGDPGGGMLLPAVQKIRN